MPAFGEDALTRAIGAHADRLGIVACYLYGSHARHQATRLRDVDIALLLESPDPRRAARIEFEVAAILGAALGIDKCDVRARNTEPLTLQGEILTHGRCLFCTNQARRVDFEDRVRGEYFNVLPALRQTTAARLRRSAAKGFGHAAR